MPEGPELHIASRFVNNACQGVTFSGKVRKSEVSTKNPDVDWEEKCYTISSTARGKEVKLILTASTSGNNDKSKKKSIGRQLTIVVRFGMSGKFEFVPVEDIAKHAHLNFYTSDGEKVLSFVDYRRFGKWEVDGDWGPERGPCIITEYEAFRRNVLENLSKAVFNKAICEAMLDQKFFNGVGNYLRAEILYRLKIPPFAQARSVLEPLADAELQAAPNAEDVKDEKPGTVNGEAEGHSGKLLKVKKEPGIKEEAEADILQLCHQLAHEVLSLNVGEGYVYKSGNQTNKTDEEDGYSAFSDWLQCYYQPDMKNLVDHNGRTIWFTGPAGPMTPTNKKTRGVVAKRGRIETSTKKMAASKLSNEDLGDAESSPKKRRKMDASAKKNSRKTPTNGSTRRSKNTKGKVQKSVKVNDQKQAAATQKGRKRTVKALNGVAPENVQSPNGRAGLRRSCRSK